MKPFRRFGKRIASVFAGLLAAISSQGALIRGPYLQSAAAESIVVRWRTDAAEPSVVRFGVTPDQLAENAALADAVTEHVVTLGRLHPGTKYYYSVGTKTATLASGADFFFVTPPAPGTPKPVRFWVLGDPGTADANARAVRDAYEHFVGERPTDFCLLLGDNAYPDGTDEEYQRGIFDIYPEMLRHTALWPALGNHDGHSAKSATQSGPYYDIFTLPTHAEAGGTASGTEAYYSFDYANLHLICLDSSDTNRAPDGAMIHWLKADMAATRQDWIIAFFHHPPYTKGNHDSDLIKGNRDLFEVRQNILPVLEAGGVDLILTGHSHDYERSQFLDGYYGTSADYDPKYLKQKGDGRPDGDGAYTKPRVRTPHAGEVIVVDGSSGKTAPRNKALLNHPAMVSSYLELGSLVVTVNAWQLDVTFLNERGIPRDTFRMVKE